MYSQDEVSNGTNGRVRDVFNHHSQSASRELSEGRVTEANLLEQESIVPEYVGCPFRTHERGDRIGLGIVEVTYEIDWFGVGTNRVSDNENWVFELCGCVRGKLLNRTNGPSILLVSEGF